VNLLTAALATFLSFLFTGLAMVYARRTGLIDVPGERHSHSRATPRGGGAGLVLAFVLMAVAPIGVQRPDATYTVILPAFVTLALLGWLDDHRPLRARTRFVVQLLASVFLVWNLPLSGPYGAAWFTVAAVLFAAWMINLYNFMDGSNGMAAGQGVFAATLLAWLFQRAGEPGFATLSLLMAACCVGFLPWNLGRARVFMGDVGSLALGFFIAALLLYGVSGGAFSLPVGLMVMAVFLADSTLTLLLRVSRGERWYNAHRQHLYQRLIARGWTHGRVLLVYQIINLVVVLPAVVFGVSRPDWAWPVAVTLGAALALAWYLSIKKTGVLAAAR
jgi:UDP-N-acetylmuramyl pentapeptide phosphotransferase/UDP-N-acetylglucosamine-1-phosphate transferase